MEYQGLSWEELDDGLNDAINELELLQAGIEAANATVPTGYVSTRTLDQRRYLIQKIETLRNLLG